MVYFQTYGNNKRLISEITNSNPDIFLSRELEIRKSNKLPPYERFISLILTGENEEKLEKDALLEMKAGGLDDVSEFARELYNISDVIDVLETDDVNTRISSEVYNLDGLPEDDDYGEGDNQGDYN